MRAPDSWMTRGMLAGLAAGTAMIVWFLVVDTAAGEPLRTVDFLARTLFGGEVGAGLIAAYTLIHYAVFAALGIGVAWVVERLDAVPPFLLGLVLGFLLFDLFFYGRLLLTGVDILGELGWPVLLVGNLVAGVAMMEMLAMLGSTQPVDWRSTLARHATLREGMLAGLLGAGLVALWFLLFDLVQSRPLYTPAALGSALLSGARSAGDVDVGAATVLGFTIVHVAGFLLIGLVAAAVFAAAEEVDEVALLGGVLLFVVFEAFSIGLLTIIASWLFETVPWWTVAVANLIAAAGMGWYLMRRHLRLMHDLRHHELEEELAHDGSPLMPAP